MNHDIVMFPSWFNHAKLNEKRSQLILETMKWTSFRDLPKESVRQFVEQFGAVHFSSVFAPEWEGSIAQKHAAMKSVSGDEEVWNTQCLGPWTFKDDYLRNFLVPLWLQLRDIYASKKSNMAINLAKIVGCENPTHGLARAIVTLISHEVKELQEESSSSTSRDPVAMVKPRGSVAGSLLGNV